MRKIYIASLALVALAAGCGTLGVIPQEQAGPLAENYKEVLKKYVQATFKDPDSVKDAEIAKPVPYRVFDRRGYVICYKANAKNSYGGYTGTQILAVMMYGTEITSYGSSVCPQVNAVYEPWPEVNGKK